MNEVIERLKRWLLVEHPARVDIMLAIDETERLQSLIEANTIEHGRKINQLETENEDVRWALAAFLHSYLSGSGPPVKAIAIAERVTRKQNA